MSLFGSLLKTGFDVVTSPIEVVKDIATMGGVYTDQRETYTGKRLRRLVEDAEDIREDMEEL